MNDHLALKDKVVIVTGVTRGIGKEVALAYAQAGATVVLLGRNTRLLEALYDEIVALNAPEPIAVTLDLHTAQEHDFDQLALAVYKETGRLDGIVHCAGYFYALSPLMHQTIEEWMNQYRVNTVAPMALTRACLPLLQKSDDASVILVGESHADDPKAYWGGFGASYAGLQYLCKVAADEWSQFQNVRINTLVPGQVNSPLRLKTHPGESKSERKEIAQIVPDFIYWMSQRSAGRTGNIIKL
ncbi:SDR family oxidoreductase [Neisseria sp. Ec49-e6-T10]|uniref:SDR family oxidoreductase n=1 Tax=Neisseria sp. Ec49-e6-T10 TaxID=3140744 RepID=UPI003EB7AA6F